MLNNFYPIRIVAPQLHYFGRVFYFMAKDKKSFLLYCDIIHTVEQLTDEQAGSLFKHILQYVNDKEPCSESIITKIAFEPIKQSLKRDLDRYDSICKRNSDNAKKRWDATASDRIPNDTKNADSDRDSDKDIKSIKEAKRILPPTKDECIDLFKTNNYSTSEAVSFFHYWESMNWTRKGGMKIQKWKSAAQQWMAKLEPNKLDNSINKLKVATL
jgi:hypothetical protein